MQHKTDFVFADVQKLLLHLGVAPHYTGYRYAEYALMLLKEDEERILSVTKWLYPEIARKYHTTVNAVERNIRTLSEVAWKTEPEKLEKLAGHTLVKRPTSSQFLALLFAYLMDAVSKKSAESPEAM